MLPILWRDVSCSLIHRLLPPGAGRVHGRGLRVAGAKWAICVCIRFVFRSYSLRILLVFSSHFPLVLPPGLGRACVIPNEPMAGVDGARWAGIQMKTRFSRELRGACRAAPSAGHFIGVEFSALSFMAQTFGPDRLRRVGGHLTCLTRAGSLLCSRAPLTEWFLTQR